LDIKINLKSEIEIIRKRTRRMKLKGFLKDLKVGFIVSKYNFPSSYITINSKELLEK
jgi:hypothetical protein